MTENQNETPQLRENAVMQSVLISEKDFRIGNFFYGNYENEIDEKIESVICTILGYDPFNSFYWVENKEGIEDFCSFQKIPLTKEWLLRFGAKEDAKGYYWVNIFSDNTTEVYIYSNPFGFGIGISKEFKEFSFDIKCKYVHELQNLYFSFTGRELTVA